MPVITVAQSKGGAGKSTIALTLASEFAAAGGSVLLLDADDQISLVKWARDRAKEGRETNTIRVQDVSDVADPEIINVIADARQRAQLVIIDTKGDANMKTAYCCQESDFVIIPSKSSRLDLERAVETQVMLNRMAPTVPYKVLITQTPMVGRSRTEFEIDKQIRDNFPTFEQHLHLLDAYRAIYNFRLTMVEVAEENVARTERAREIAQSLLSAILTEIPQGENQTEEEAA